MIFNSIEFLVFALLFFLLWPLFRKKDTSRWFLLVSASFIFYGWWDWRFLFLIIFSGLVDYFAGILLIKFPERKKVTLTFSLIANLGSLFIFKYSVFAANIVQDLLRLVHLELDLVARIPDFALILPVGISFYTFQSLSYTIDIYRGRLQPTRNILHFFAFLTMFPQLVAGPIIRASDFLKQLSTYRIPTAFERWNAFKMICFGLFQKVVIADNLSLLIDSAYEGKAAFSGSLFWWYVVVAFSIQIYADFSGYSLIARGLAKMMGYHFKMNFNHPYLSTSIRQFWNRWHISLSTWFRDYVYIPLGGSHKGLYFGYYALAVTMLLSGIWHGANYTFIFWALLHTVFIIVERQTKWTAKLANFSVVSLLIVFVQVTIAWVFFRSSSLPQAGSVIGSLFSFQPTNVDFFTTYYHELRFLYLALLIEFFIYLRKEKRAFRLVYHRNQVPIDVLLVSSSIVFILFLRGEGQQFIYFQF